MKVCITETLQRIVDIDADTKEEAIEKVKKAYRDEEIVLDYNDYVETICEVVED